MSESHRRSRSRGCSIRDFRRNLEVEITPVMIYLSPSLPASPGPSSASIGWTDLLRAGVRE
jgi:hypothetical protein